MQLPCPSASSPTRSLQAQAAPGGKHSLKRLSPDSVVGEAPKVTELKRVKSNPSRMQGGDPP